MLHGISGNEICMTNRKKFRVPIIMLIAKSEEASHLKGLDIGAEDYITEPFSLEILIAGIKTVLRHFTADVVPLTVKKS